jgi:hypothetical protein
MQSTVKEYGEPQQKRTEQVVLIQEFGKRSVLAV